MRCFLLHDSHYQQVVPDCESVSFTDNLNYKSVFECENCSIILSTSTSSRIRHAVQISKNSQRISFYTPHTYIYHPTQFCWHQYQCISYDIVAALHSIFIYNAQAYGMFPAFAHKMRWMPVSWAGTPGVTNPKSAKELKRSWTDLKNATCHYFVAIGYHKRDWTALLAALKKIKSYYPLHIVGAKCPNPFTRVKCIQALNTCQKMFPKCVLHGYLSKTKYAQLILNACFVVIPVQNPDFGMGLTGVSEALLLGKVVVTTSLNTPSYNISQWTNYIMHNQTGILLQENQENQWLTVLIILQKNIPYLKALQKNAQTHANLYFTSEYPTHIIYHIMADSVSTRFTI